MIADCVRSHVAWLRVNAVLCGGEIGSSGSADWAWVPADGTMHLLFPPGPDRADVAAVLERGRAVGARTAALWSATDRDLGRLEGLGLERGRQPWWMAGAPADVPAARTEHVRVVTTARGYGRARAPLRADPDVLLAEARVGRFRAGRAWMHVDEQVAGLYDMEVGPRHRRRGLGRDLLGALARGATERGASIITMNATPDGAALYRACGFRMLGAGRTWWWHRSG